MELARSFPHNKALPWSLELIERFENRWDWVEVLSEKQGPALVP